jgi:hypothetical protein
VHVDCLQLRARNRYALIASQRFSVGDGLWHLIL